MERKEGRNVELALVWFRSLPSLRDCTRIQISSSFDRRAFLNPRASFSLCFGASTGIETGKRRESRGEEEEKGELARLRFKPLSLFSSLLPNFFLGLKLGYPSILVGKRMKNVRIKKKWLGYRFRPPWNRNLVSLPPFFLPFP